MLERIKDITIRLYGKKLFGIWVFAVTTRAWSRKKLNITQGTTVRHQAEWAF